MFSLVSGVYDSYLAPTQLNLLVVGAGGVGKTALLERLKVTQFTKKLKAEVSQDHVDEDRQPPLPYPFLPLALREELRLRGESFHSHQSNHSSKQHKKKKKSKKKQQQQQQQQKPRRSFLACPAPSRYSNANKDSSSDEEESNNEFNDGDDSDSEVADDNSLPAMPSQNGLAQEHHQTSLEDVPLAGDSETHVTSTPARAPIKENSPTDDDNEDDGEDQDYDLKPKLRMLPLHKIRPTIGMNLGKVEMCGAKCHVWDLGGKMHNLWSRYYQDCDAVIFVWKIVDDEDPRYTRRDTNGDDDSDDDDVPVVTAAQQLQLLEQVRESIPDDVPFLVWGHWFPPLPTMKRDTSAYHYNVAYSTGALLPHYHNPLMTLYFGSAKSGAGVRTAMEWLIPMAARQKKYRDKAASSEEKL